MKSLIQKSIVTLLFSLFGLAVLPAHAGFSSLYVFGDALSSTTDGTTGPYYYPGRDSNGRTWIEVLAQRQGLAYDASKNNSYYDHNSATLVTDILTFKKPADISTALFVVWVCNADTFDAAQNHDTPLQWTLDTTLSQANHLQVITTLYTMGVRNLVLPNAVDISRIPAYNRSSLAGVMHNGCVAYNAALANTINQARLLCPDLTIYTPDYYTLLNNVLTNAASYGLVNALNNGSSIDVLSDPTIANKALNGKGTNYIFWDNQDPTAMLHEIMADVAQQIISPVKIAKLAPLNGGNRLDLANIPIGLNGFVEGTTNLTLIDWTGVTNIASTSSAQSIFVNAAPLQLPPIPPSSGGSGGGIGDPSSGTGTNNVPFPSAAQFYRVSFPFAWSWP